MMRSLDPFDKMEREINQLSPHNNAENNKNSNDQFHAEAPAKFALSAPTATKNAANIAKQQ